jgi:hypothetical protein
MSESKMRDEFEVWHSDQVVRLMEHNEPTAARVWKDFKEMDWNVWQASREALVIELPDADGLNREHMLVQGFIEGVAHTRVAIEAAGLKVKP